MELRESYILKEYQRLSETTDLKPTGFEVERGSSKTSRMITG